LLGKASARMSGQWLVSGRPRRMPVSRGVPRHSVSYACTASCARFRLDLRPHGFPAPAARGPSTPTYTQAGPSAAAGSYYRWGPLQHVQHQINFATSRGTICNICPKQLKHLQYMSETRGKHVCRHCKTYATPR
jgi:hypothetical protein